MNIKKTPLKIFAAAALLLCAACATNDDVRPQKTNIAGIITYEENSFDSTGANTFALSTDELYQVEIPSGDKVTLLWGLITLKDY